MSRSSSRSAAPELPLIVGVVGHTNTGKTSLVRTLLRDARFGEVNDAAGTTRHVEAAEILHEGQPYLELRDTPGLEDAIALEELLDEIAPVATGRAKLQTLLDAADDHLDFDQEIKVLRQALSAHALLYVVDCRDDVFEKYTCELSVLKLAARPILPVLNFIEAEGAQLEVWRTALADLGLHAIVAFDTVAFDFNAEKRLYEKMQTLLESHYEPLQTLLDARARQWRQLRAGCVAQVAQLLVSVSEHSVAVNTAAPASAQREELRDYVRGREQRCLETILQILGFDALEVALPELNVNDGEWEVDLFAPENLKAMGLDTASAAATGAALGAGVDIFLAGLSLGAASATGAALGAAYSTSRRYGRSFFDRLQGRARVGADELTVELLLKRQLRLLQALFSRGHAAQQKINLDANPSAKLPASWSEQARALRRVRGAEPQVVQEVELGLCHWLEALL